ncbi:uncharacterized protein LOC127747668 [Arachis duranensis]|uniref:Uncharacterized protein LOC127747668 n=1 Tax=Arachis duranensis TaxID=130453 RepID=A0A9C6WJ84_ARADU|nr:uncharacterized protein LOC127747668 [Arachis duranensis]
MGATPFHHSILEVQLAKHFDKPTDMRYDGTQDPQKYLTAFEARMILEGPVIRWFNALPQGSVTTFADITRAFLAQFTTCIVKANHLINLLGVTQRSGEPTRKYLDRFNNKYLEIDGLTDSVASLCLTNGMLNEDFRKHLTTKPVWTMQEIQNMAREYINDEEVSQVVAANKWQPAHLPTRQPGNGERSREHSKDGGPTKPFKPFPRVGKFTNYTPLTVPMVEVYQQIADKGILSKPRQLKDRTSGNKNLYCDYHKGFGHKTQDCFDLKDALEQAIREANDGSVGSIRGDLEMAVACDNASLSLRKKSKEASRVFLADLDARIDDKPRLEPEGDLEKFRVGDSEDKFTFINRNLPHNLKEPLIDMIRANGDLFTWTPVDMPGIDH